MALGSRAPDQARGGHKLWEQVGSAAGRLIDCLGVCNVIVSTEQRIGGGHGSPATSPMRFVPACGPRRAHCMLAWQSLDPCAGPAAATRRTASATRTPRASGPTSAPPGCCSAVSCCSLLLFVSPYIGDEPYGSALCKGTASRPSPLCWRRSLWRGFTKTGRLLVGQKQLLGQVEVYALHGSGAGAVGVSSGLCMQVCHGIAQLHGCCTITGAEAACARRVPSQGAARAREEGFCRAAVGLDVWLGGLVARPSQGHLGTGRWGGVGRVEVG